MLHQIVSYLSVVSWLSCYCLVILILFLFDFVISVPSVIHALGSVSATYMFIHQVPWWFPGSLLLVTILLTLDRIGLFSSTFTALLGTRLESLLFVSQVRHSKNVFKKHRKYSPIQNKWINLVLLPFSGLIQFSCLSVNPSHVPITPRDYLLTTPQPTSTTCPVEP